VPDEPGASARERWIDALFELEGEARAAALDAPGVPEEWRAQAARLCALDATPGILDREPDALARTLFEGAAPPPAPVAGASAGRYRLERLVGEGGMATVWLARHEDARLPQQVAVKCLRTTLSTPEWRERFLREQRILARLTHPNVTRLFDAGITASGTPYIVMEYVDGLPITEYCDRHRLSCRERVRLFLKVCASVAYAHRSLIVHRDLKPRNVLVGADGEPHLLDFGIAKLLDLTDADAHMTRTGLLLLTPAYAAPEQFEHGPVTTATDVYGLGALLHELLSGARPRHHADGRLQLASGRASGEAAASRDAATAGALRRILRGDLDAILERALRREPELRYASAGALAEDLERWLDGTVVRARSGSLRYRVSRFVQRHWLVLGLVFLALTGLTVTTAISLRQSARAEQSFGLALAEARRVALVRDFMQELLYDMRPGGMFDSPGDLLDRAAQLARERFAHDAEQRAALLVSVGELNRGYGRLDASRRVLEEAAATARGHGGDRSPIWLEAEAHLGHTAFRRGEPVRALRRLQEALRLYDAAGGAAGPERVRALIFLGALHQNMADHAPALARLQEAFEAAQRLSDPADPVRQLVLEYYGSALSDAGRFEHARRVLAENVALARARYGSHDPAVAAALETQAVTELSAGRPAATLPLLEEARGIVARLRQPHVTAAYVENTLGNALLRLGRTAEAQAAYGNALRIYHALYPPPHPMLVATHINLGEAAFEQGRFDAAAAAFDAAAAQRQALADAVRFGGIDADCLAGEAHARGARREHGLALLERCVLALEGDERNSDYLAFALGALAAAQLDAARAGEAELNARRALTLRRPAMAHERLLPLGVLLRQAAGDGEREAVERYAGLALDALAGAEVARPCETARQLAGMAERVAETGAAVLAERLRERARGFGCRTPPPAGKAAGPGAG
jgi:tetratricopeptide (TPR) repeat protein